MLSFLCDQLTPLGNISYKRMFSGYGVFLNQHMIGIVQHDNIYIKKLNVNQYEQRFSYQRQGKTIYLNYVLIDNSLIDEQDELIQLVKSYLFDSNTLNV